MSHREASDEAPEVKLNLSRLGVVLGVIATIFALAGAWVVLPYRVDQVEKTVTTHSAEMQTMKEVLIRIDENVKELRRSERRDLRTTRTEP